MADQNLRPRDEDHNSSSSNNRSSDDRSSNNQPNTPDEKSNGKSESDNESTAGKKSNDKSTDSSGKKSSTDNSPLEGLLEGTSKRTDQLTPILTALADTPSLPKSAFRRLPKPIRRVLPIFTEQVERGVFATAGLGVLSGCLPKVWGRYDTGLYAPHLFTLITAPAASGKGVLTHARKLGEEVEAYFEDEFEEAKRAAKQSTESEEQVDPTSDEDTDSGEVGDADEIEAVDVDNENVDEEAGTKTPRFSLDTLFDELASESEHDSIDSDSPETAPPDGEPDDRDSGHDEQSERQEKGGLAFDCDPDDISKSLVPPWERKKSPGANQNTASEREPGDEPVLRRLYLSGDISSSALVLFMDENGRSSGEGFGIVFETEIDTVVKTQKQEWGGTSDILRKAHAHETVSYLRVGERRGDRKGGESRKITRPTLAVVLAGTPKQMLKLIPSPEDGLFSRFLFYGFLPDDPLSWKDVRPKEDAPDPADLLAEGAREVRRLWTTLEGRTSDLRVRLQPHHWKRLNQRMRKVKVYLFARFDYAGSSTAHRTGLHIFRLAMTLAVWRAFEEGVDLAHVESVTVEDEEFDAALKLGLTYARHATEIMRALPREESTPAMNEEEARLFGGLPDREEFERSDALKTGKKLGIPKRTVDRKLRMWVKTGQLRKVRRGVYEKVLRASSGSASDPSSEDTSDGDLDGDSGGDLDDDEKPENPS